MSETEIAVFLELLSDFSTAEKQELRGLIEDNAVTEENQ